MKRPSFQFYPADWRNNANLRRCSLAARGAWIEVMCLLADSDDFGFVRWTFSELCAATGVPVKIMQELRDKGVLKGNDAGIDAAFMYTPRSGRKNGEPVELIAAQDGPLWYSSRMVVDEYKRHHAGANTRFGASPSRRQGEGQGERRGDNQGDGSTSTTTSTTTSNEVVGTTPTGGGGGNAPPLQNDRDAQQKWIAGELRSLTKNGMDETAALTEAAKLMKKYPMVLPNLITTWANNWLATANHQMREGAQNSTNDRASKDEQLREAIRRQRAAEG